MVTPAGNNVCRRCKKKRPEDEPIETSRYRTCKPCREIERKRKRLKKITGGFASADGEAVSKKAAQELEQSIINIASHVSKQLPQDPVIVQPQLAHHAGPPQIQQYDQSKKELVTGDEKEIPIDESLLKEGAGRDDDSPSLTKSPRSPQDASNLFAEKAEVEGDTQSPSPGDALNHCLYCGAKRTINDDGRYQLCGNCVDNPLQRANVFDNFESYLQKIETGRDSDLKNVIFIRKFEDDSEIPDFTKDNLSQVLSALHEKFISRMMQSSGFKFSKSSSNLSAKPFPKSIKLLYKCKQDVKTMQKQTAIPNSPGTASRKLKTENCNSNFYLSYDVMGKNLSIKYNHSTHKTFLEKLYSAKLIEKVRQLQLSYPDIGEVFDHLLDAGASPEVLSEIEQLKKVSFVKDFGTLPL